MRASINALLHHYFRPLIYILLLAAILLINGMNRYSYLLNTEHAPRGIISLEMNGIFNFDQKKIINDWKQNKIKVINAEHETKPFTGLQAAKDQTNLDYVFIAVYVSLLCLIIFELLKNEYAPGWFHAGLWLVPFGGFMDVLENIQMLNAMNNPNVNPLYICLPSTLKWIIELFWILAILYILFKKELLFNFFQELSSILTGGLNILWKFRIVIIGLSVIFLFLWLLDQGKDMLLTINSSIPGTLLFLSTTLLLALFNWFFPKLYDQVDHETLRHKSIYKGTWNYKFGELEKSKTDIARILGTLTFFVPATGILNAMQSFNISYWGDQLSPFLILIVLTILTYLGNRYRLTEKYFLKNGSLKLFSFRFTLCIGIIILLLLILFQILSSEDTLGILALELFILACLFYFIISLRVYLFTSHIKLQSQPVAPYIWNIGILVTSIFLLLNTFPLKLGSTDRFVALPVVYISIISYLVIFTYLLLSGRKYKVHLISLLFVVATFRITIGVNNYHRLSLVTQTSPRKPDSLKNYIKSWLEHRRSEISTFSGKDSNKKYPVFFINTYGGGIRAAAWTTFFINQVNCDSSIKIPINAARSKHPDIDFQHLIFSYSGASGGTIGASVLCAARYSELFENKNNILSEKSFSLFQSDFLTPVIIGLLGRDVIFSLVGLNWPDDRAALLAKTWEKHTGNAGINYTLPFSKYWYDNKGTYNFEVPLLFSNTYDADSGIKGITVAVKLSNKDFPGSTFIEDRINKNCDDLTLSEGSFLSARFPFISPSGKFDDMAHFVDGGYKENSGAETSLEVNRVFERELQKLIDEESLKFGNSIFKHIKIYLISLQNGVDNPNAGNLKKSPVEITEPLTGLLNNSNGNTLTADTLNRWYAAKYEEKYITIQPTEYKLGNFWPKLPLGWQISDSALSMMNKSLRKDPNVRNISRVISDWKKYRIGLGK